MPMRLKSWGKCAVSADSVFSGDGGDLTETIRRLTQSSDLLSPSGR